MILVSENQLLLADCTGASGGLMPVYIIKLTVRELKVFYSIQIYSHMSESRRFFHPSSPRSREFQLARMMMILVLVFLLLNIPRLLLGLHEVTQISRVELCYRHDQDYNVSKETFFLDFIARFLVVINSSINFLIYCLAGSQFRQKLKSLLGRNSSQNAPLEELSVETRETFFSRNGR